MSNHNFRHYFTDYRALLPYSALGIVAGILAALVILLFDQLIELISHLWLQKEQGFASLPPWQRFALPSGGAFLLGVLFLRLAPEDREVGIVHVLSRMHSHYGHLPMRNLLVQLGGGAIALATGQSGGREGPGVHLGAAISSSLAHRFGLPDNSQRILIACGTAGAISVAFNTPLAGVIFAMEVIIAEYTVVGFTPVILAAVSANTIYHIVGGEPIIQVPTVAFSSLWELPFIVLLGLLAGVAASLFILLLKQTLKLGHLPLLVRFTLAGAVVGGLAIAVPPVLGIGYDSLAQVLANQLTTTLLISLLIAKIIATACSVGLGLPIGLIGPNLIVGACLGALVGHWGAEFMPALSSDPVLYALIGMGACMAAVLNAPLAALLALVELTQNVGIVLPVLLAVVAANITRGSLFRQQSAHQTVLRHLKREVSEDPVGQLLQQTNIQSAMSTRYLRTPETASHKQTVMLIEDSSDWVLVEREGKILYILQGAELRQSLAQSNTGQELNIGDLDLRRWASTSIRSGATLREAMDTIRNKAIEAVLVTDFYQDEGRTVRGVVTRDIIERFYLNKL